MGWVQARGRLPGAAAGVGGPRGREPRRGGLRPPTGADEPQTQRQAGLGVGVGVWRWGRAF